MKRPELLLLVFFACVNLSALAQNQKAHSKLLGNNPTEIGIHQSYNQSGEIFKFDKNINLIFGLSVEGSINVTDPDNFYVSLVLIDEENNPHQIYESYQYLESETSISVSNLAEETCILNGIRPYSVELKIENAEISINNFKYATGVKAGWDIEKLWHDEKEARDNEKIQRINNSLKSKGQHWVAGKTEASEMSLAERLEMYGQSTFPAGFEYYAGGVISASTSSNSTGSTSVELKSATATSPYIDEWDWRNRHGQNWMTSIKNQSTCGSCWAFATAGATEALTNLFFNQHLDLDLSEQNLLSCSGAGDCSGGYPYIALDYIISNGVVDEGAFPYSKTEEPCSNISNTPTDRIKIGGRIKFGTAENPRSEDLLKKWLIETGPVSGGLYNWSHAMTLVGYKVVKEGDYMYYSGLDLQRNWYTVEAGDPLIGKTVWIFKNSWGPYFGDRGYVYVETAITNIGWTHALKTPVTSVVNNYDVICEDRDGDGYYWWGLGEKPENCPDCPDLADGDDSDPTKGPLDEFGYCMSLTGEKAPVASFTSNKQEINTGESISLTDQSVNSPTSWNWVFNGGTPATSTLQNPVVTYNTTGTYPIKLTVSNATGSDTKVMDAYIKVAVPVAAPVADFTSNSQTIFENEDVSFTDISSNTPTTWNWIFEGGSPSTSTTKNPVVSYSTEGIYNVTLTVSNEGGNNTKTIQNYITVNKPAVLPVANFTANTNSIEVGASVSFYDFSQNSPYAWNWEFEGGTPSTSSQKNPVVSYNTAGTYQVKLTVTNSDGSDTKTIGNFIDVTEKQNVIIAPVADFSTSTTNIEAGESVTFADQSSNAPTSWAWTFEGGNPATSTAQNPVVSYSTAGDYSVSLTATNASGSDTKTTSQIIHVTETVTAPVADFAANKRQITEGESVDFTDKSLNTPSSWLWVFEGGSPSTSTERNPRVTYAKSNNFKVSLTVTNAGGNNTKTIENYIQVEQAQPEYCIPSPIASEEWISKVQLGNTIKTSGAEGYADFTATTFAVEAGSSPTIELVPDFVSRSKFEYWSVWIDFNSDYIFSDDELVFSASKSKSAVSGSIAIPANLDLTTRMRVAMGKSAPAACGFNDYGEIEDYTLRIMPVQPKPPVADFAANKYTIYVGESVQFTDLSSNEPTSWSWSFPGADVTTSTAQNPVVTYSTTGVFDVTLTVSKPEFGSSTETKQALITVKEYSETNNYCTPTDVNSASNYISKVNIGSFISVVSGGDGYSLSGTQVNLIPGKSYTVDLFPSLLNSRDFWRVWIDFNNDGDFDDADETLLAENNNRGNLSGYIDIPSYATGTTRMRITMKTGKAPASCDAGFEGEVEDYEVSFGDASQNNQIASSSSSLSVEPQNYLSVYPNPTQNSVNIKLSIVGENDSYAVYTATGGKVIEKSISAPLSKIDLSAQPSGLYFIVINNMNHNYTEKIIKK